MIPEKIKLVVNQLIEKTKEKKAFWLKTSRPNEFKLKLSSGTITTDTWYNSDDDTSLYDISLYNSAGDKIETIVVQETEPEDYHLLKELNSEARKSYFKVDDTLINMLKEINDTKIIGSESKEDSTHDDLPF